MRSQLGRARVRCQDWAQSHDWSSQRARFSVTTASDSSRGASSRVRRQEKSDDLQLYVEDVQNHCGHSFLTTRSWSVIDLAGSPTHVILDLACTKSMGSRHAVNKFVKKQRLLVNLNAICYPQLPSSRLPSQPQPRFIKH